MNARTRTPWSAAYAYAEAMGELAAEWDSRQKDADSTAPRDYTAAQVLIARAITIDADRAGITVTGIEDFGPLSLVALYTEGLHPLKAVLDFATPNLGHTPEPAEPGFDAFTALWQVTQARGATVEDLAADDHLQGQVQDEINEKWMSNIELAQGLVMATVQTVGTALFGPVPLSLLTERARRRLPS